MGEGVLCNVAQTAFELGGQKCIHHLASVMVKSEYFILPNINIDRAECAEAFKLEIGFIHSLESYGFFMLVKMVAAIFRSQLPSLSSWNSVMDVHASLLGRCHFPRLVGKFIPVIDLVRVELKIGFDVINRVAIPPQLLNRNLAMKAAHGAGCRRVIVHRRGDIDEIAARHALVFGVQLVGGAISLDLDEKNSPFTVAVLCLMGGGIGR